MDKDLLRKLRNMASTQCNNKVSEMLKNPKCFEICCAIEKSLAAKSEVCIWSDIPLEIKSSLGLPVEDVGIDYMDLGSTFAGQAKLYKDHSLVKACDIDRTRLCAYRASKYSKKLDIMQYCEITTPSNVKLSRSKIEMNDVTHNIITRERMNEIYRAALGLKIVPEKQLQASHEKKLRKCQIDALANIVNGRINRIRMACGSGKSRVALEVIKRKHGRYLILVPYITLLEQWDVYLTQFGITTILIGTGYNGQVPVYNKDKAIVTICVNNSYEKALYYEFKGTTLRRPFEYIIVDEAHHVEDAPEEGMNGKLWEVVQKNKNVVLLSASLDNEDKECHYNYSLRDAINDGVCCDYDIRLSYFDESPSFETIAKYISENLEYISILAYCNNVETARNVADACNRIGVKAVSLSCEESKGVRQNVIDDFEKGVYRVLASVRTLGEGINIKRADTCMFIDSRGEIATMQCVGRVVRKDEGKKMAHIVVFSSIKEGDDIGKDPMVKILRKISHDDVHAVKKNYRMWVDVVRGVNETDDEYERRGVWIKDEVYDSMMKCINRGNWNGHFDELYSFYIKHGRLPKQGEKTYKWLAKQRNAARGRDGLSMSVTHKEKLDKTFYGWLDTYNSWDDSCEKLINFVKQHNRLPKTTEPPSGPWLFDQIRKLKGQRGKISDEQKEYLDKNVPGWSITRMSDEHWLKNYKEFASVVKKLGRFPRSTEYMAKWYHAQRRTANGKGRGKLTQKQKELMDETFPNWLK
jgi:superfamily II DNA or RNA helicase